MHPNVERHLTNSGVAFVHRRHIEFGGVQTPREFAVKLGYALERITKTLLISFDHHEGDLAVAVCSAYRRVNFAQIARLFNKDHANLASVEALQRTDYPRNGVSPLGLPHDIDVIVDDALLGWPTVLVGAGVLGEEIELNPGHLVRVTNAQVVPITE